MQTSALDLPPIVLLVEDDDDTRDLYNAALELSGLWVAKTAEPEDALEYAADLRPDVILMDIGLPTSADGFSLARAFRSDPRLAQTPIIGITGLQADEVRTGLHLFTRVFYKPVRFDDIVRQLKWLSAKGAVLRVRAAAAPGADPQLSATPQELSREGDPQGAARLAHSDTRRLCPKCRQPLSFSERRTLGGTMFEYYLPCAAGCGLYYYDHSQRKMLLLVQ